MMDEPLNPNPTADAATDAADSSETQLFSEDYFVVLASGQPEEILSAAELKAKLAEILASFPLGELPRPVQLAAADDRVQRLIDTSCELTFESGDCLQWYAVRLEKNSPD